jgi:hypothetical protein
MDKPRHPQVFRPWKTRQTQKMKFNAAPTSDSRGIRNKKPFVQKHA